MGKELEIDISKFKRALNVAGVSVGQATKEVIHDIMDDWQRESVNIAPHKTTALRTSIKGSVKSVSGGYEGQIVASAVERTRKGNFNYAYYIHEVKGDDFKGRKPNTVGRFLDIPAEENEKLWIKDIEKSIKDAAKKAGF